MGRVVLLLTAILALVLVGPAFPEMAAGQVTMDWVARFDGPAHYYDEVKALAVDSQGNVLVTGSSYVRADLSVCTTIKYGPDGQRLWVRSHYGQSSEPAALAVDALGNVYVTGKCTTAKRGSDYLTIKYSPAGERLWVQRYDGPGRFVQNDAASAIALDSRGNVYVTGSSQYWFRGSDYLTIKYSPEGERLWVRRYQGDQRSGHDDAAAAIAVDAQDNIYISGTIQLSSDRLYNFDYATVKYSPEGRRLWERRYHGPGEGPDRVKALALDGQGNVLVTGESYGGLSGSDFLTIKYTPEGRRLWVQRYNGTGSGADYPSSLAADRQGNVYLTGYSYNGYSSDFTTIKYSPDGEQLWIRYFNNGGTSYNYPQALVVDGQDQVYVTGRCEALEEESGTDIVIIKYGPQGRQLWVCRYDGPHREPYNYDDPVALAVDGQGNVYVTGDSYGEENKSDFVTIKYRQTP